MARPRRAGTITLQRSARVTLRRMGGSGRPGRGGFRKLMIVDMAKRLRERTAKNTSTHLKTATSADAQLDPTERLDLVAQLRGALEVQALARLLHGRFQLRDALGQRLRALRDRRRDLRHRHRVVV